jgi:hypothetical protein
MVEKRSAKNLSLKTGLQIINFNPSPDEQLEVSMEGNRLDLGVPSMALMADGLMKHVHNSTDVTVSVPATLPWFIESMLQLFISLECISWQSKTFLLYYNILCV